MLTITVPSRRLWDEKNEEFLYLQETQLMLEHSLISISKWESKWCVPFLDKEKHTPEQMLDYIKCMTLNKTVDPNVYLCLTASNFQSIMDYINGQFTASTVNHSNKKPARSGKKITSELIYSWMVSLQIPFACEKWHLSRLLMLIDILDAENSSNKKKMPSKDIYKQNNALNAARRAKMNSKG